MGSFVCGEVARERIGALLDRVDEAYAELRELSSDEVGTAFRVTMAERLEDQERTNRGLMYRVFGELSGPPDEAGAHPGWMDKVWARVRIAPNEIRRRVKMAELIRPRRSLTGPPLPPELPAVAEAVERGAIGEDHLRIIVHRLKKLPRVVSEQDRADVQTSLVREATKSDAEMVRTVGRRIGEIFNPDGDYDEEDRARRRGLQLGPQGRDGMSRLSGWIDPETRCYVEAVTAATRPGRNLPDGGVAEVRDERSPAQRCHDGIKLGLRAGIGSGQLGSHRGHPVTVIVRTTLAELNQAAHAVVDPGVSMPGPARTGGNTAVPMRDVIRMAAASIHYLSVFDDHSERPIYLGRQKRVATADQRIICYSRDGGCTRPNCTAPGYHCAVHHSPDWAPDGLTDADCLFFACDCDHALVTKGRWSTKVTESGRLAWTDGNRPPDINHAHHPEELLRTDPDPPDGRG
ncbi:13E12 repeat family protein [Mycobacterium sp. IDR2000157661]|uniref:13E12 repeat family protein n=1 Tax=Mycobacterium sp. IDR2000157661 TaxID=2867005 RepID=UPI001EE9BC5A|nr:13E12 repeat family protein [Mycobacterium sp. IDR2000157661]ULE33730.1 13E12 repeat family protein [Mycobacterium sp. IDR2000157661]